MPQEDKKPGVTPNVGCQLAERQRIYVELRKKGRKGRERTEGQGG
jgi:hypothetical protein